MSKALVSDELCELVESLLLPIVSFPKRKRG